MIKMLSLVLKLVGTVVVVNAVAVVAVAAAVTCSTVVDHCIF